MKILKSKTFPYVECNKSETMSEVRIEICQLTDTKGCRFLSAERSIPDAKPSFVRFETFLRLDWGGCSVFAVSVFTSFPRFSCTFYWNVTSQVLLK